MSESYAITDIDGYASVMRQTAAQEYSYDDNENLDEYITIAETHTIIGEHIIGYDEQNRPMISEEIHSQIFEKICAWIFNIGLSKLAGSNRIECAWCNESNQMIFWTSEIAQNDSKANIRNKD